jgi:hypothetical protein
VRQHFFTCGQFFWFLTGYKKQCKKLASSQNQFRNMYDSLLWKMLELDLTVVQLVFYICVRKAVMYMNDERTEISFGD